MTYTPEPYQRDADETVECPQCHKFNSPDARYCDQCGYELAGSSDTQAPMQMERRSAALVNPIIDGIDGLHLSGYAAVFNTPWDKALIDKLGYQEVVQRGAFRKALSKGTNIPLLWNHNNNDVLATTRSGNLTLKEDARGLKVEANLPDSPRGHDIAALIRNGTVAGMSWGMQTTRADSSIDRNSKPPTRFIRSMHGLDDVSLVWEPSYDQTSVELRSEQFAAVTYQDLIEGVESQHDQVADSETESKGLALTHTSAVMKARIRAIELNELSLD